MRERERDSRGKKCRYDDIFEEPRAESRHLALSGGEVRWRWAEEDKSAARKIEKLEIDAHSWKLLLCLRKT